MKKTLLIAAAFVALTACNKTLIETQVPESDYGYINLGITADTEMEVAATKADESTPTYKSADGTYRVKLEKKGTSDSWEACWSDLSSGNGVLTNGWVTYAYLKTNKDNLLKVSAGTYKISAENIDGTQIYVDHVNGQMHVSGNSGEFAVEAGKSVTKSFNCSIQNSRVIFKKGDNFDSYFKNSQIKLKAKISPSVEATTFNMDWENGNTENTYNEVYLPANTEVIWTLSAIRKDSEESTTRYSYTNENKGDSYKITTSKGQCTIIELTPSTDGKGVINISINTNEDYNDNEITTTIDPIAGTVAPNN